MSGERPFFERTACVSDRGPRQVNQDAVILAQLADGTELIAVADGMGGQAAGEVASRRALEVLHAALSEGADLSDAIQAANTAVFQEGSGRADHAGMGTTLVALIRNGSGYLIANVGDSRAYRIDDRGIEQLTLDHSFIAEAARGGGMSLEEAERSPWRNAVTRAVGTEREIRVDCSGPYDAHEPHAVLLCTDGLYRVIPDDRLWAVVAGSGDVAAVVSQLAEAAAAAGTDDNTSLALAYFGGWAPSLAAAERLAQPQGNRAPATDSGGNEISQVRRNPIADAGREPVRPGSGEPVTDVAGEVTSVRRNAITAAGRNVTPGGGYIVTAVGRQPVATAPTLPAAVRAEPPAEQKRGRRRRSRYDWKSATESAIFMVLLGLVVYLAVAGLLSR